MNKKYNLCVVGAGRWGMNHVRTLNEMGVLGGVVDCDDKTKKNYKKNTQIVCFFQI